MRFLMDTSCPHMEKHRDRPLVAGQLITPRTRYGNWGGTFAIDNGAFSGFNRKMFAALLANNQEHRERCLFAVVPDIVGNARRTLEIWKYRHKFVASWPMALVAQDGIEDLEIPWDTMDALFIGGCDPWKDSRAAMDIVRTAKTLGIHAHIGRVNSIKRYERFAAIGADTCDGSGAAKYDHMLEAIENHLSATAKQKTMDFDELPTVG